MRDGARHDDPPGQALEQVVQAEMLRWRASVVAYLLRAEAVVLLVTAAWWIFQRQRMLIGPFLAMAIASAVLSVLPDFSYRTRVAWLVTSMVGAGVFTLVTHGVTPNSFTAFCAATVLATVLMGRRSGVLVAGLATT